MHPRSILLFILALFLLGCSSKLNTSSFGRIKRNMSLQEVEGLLGPGKDMTDEEILAHLKGRLENAPDDVRKSAEKMTVQDVQRFTGKRWQEGSRMITVLFRDERVQQSLKEGF